MKVQRLESDFDDFLAEERLLSGVETVVVDLEANHD
jgi:hypothetical protein